MIAQPRQAIAPRGPALPRAAGIQPTASDIGPVGQASAPLRSNAFADLLNTTAITRPDPDAAQPVVQKDFDQQEGLESYLVEQAAIKPYSDAIHQAMLARTTAEDWDKPWRWSEGARKYADRHAQYLSNMEKKLGSQLVDVSVPRGYETTAYVVTDANGKKYVVDTPHSPGGEYHDLDLGEGAVGLGLGDLGGWGTYKNLPQNAGASYLPYEEFWSRPAPTLYEADDINVKPKGGFLGGLGPIASIAAAIPGPWQIPAVALSAANSASAGDPLGAILSVAGYAVPNLNSTIGASLGITNPALAKAAGSAILGGARSAASGGDFLGGVVTGGLGSYGIDTLSSALPTDMRWLARPLVSGGLSVLRGQTPSLQNLALQAVPTFVNQNYQYNPSTQTMRPRAPVTK